MMICDDCRYSKQALITDGNGRKSVLLNRTNQRHTRTKRIQQTTTQTIRNSPRIHSIYAQRKTRKTKQQATDIMDDP